MSAARRPPRLLAIAFAVAIAVGTVVLTLPISRATGETVPVITALFTAASALCVTGLAVVDTQTYWTTFGQVNIMVLIQIGGFGVMTLGSVLSIALTRRMQLRARIATAYATHIEGLSGMRWILLRILKITVIAEASITVMLGLRFWLYYDY